MFRAYTHVQGLLPGVLAMRAEECTYRQVVNRINVTKEWLVS